MGIRVCSFSMAKPKENPHRVVTFLSNWQMSLLRKISDQNYRAPISSLVRQAVQEFCQKHLPKHLPEARKKA
jgi:hypothetical protein